MEKLGLQTEDFELVVTSVLRTEYSVRTLRSTEYGVL